MKSIRLSLIVYFLLLVGVGLGAVCLLFYVTTAETLQEKERSAHDLYVSVYEKKTKQASLELDEKLLRQTRSLASRTLSDRFNYETFYPLGVLTSMGSPQGHLTVPLWVAEGTDFKLSSHLRGFRKGDVVLTAATPVVDPGDDFPHDEPDPPYYQLFRGHDFHVLQTSDALGMDRFTLDEDIKKAKLFEERLDTVEVCGKAVRRVTFKGAVPRSRIYAWPFPFYGGRLPPSPKGGGPPGGGAKRPALIESPAPTFYLMCATDLEPLKMELAGFKVEMDENLSRLSRETETALASLRLRLFLIGVATFATLFFGSFLALFLCLRPLQRLSEAVSQVSERDFELPLRPEAMPVELQPVVERLRHTLRALQSAFDREKQSSADISHELRTPLAALLTNLDVALRKQRTPDQYREILQECHASGQQMYQLVERLLSLARLDAGAVRVKAEELEVGTLAQQCANLVRPLAEERGLALSVSASPIALKGDPDKLREVITNLLHNAIEYNKPNGSIELMVQRNNGHVELAVKDTGIGIAPEARERIFERFFRADPSRQADTPHAGLGLSIVKSYVDLMGGTIAVESSPAGSTFTIALPATAVLSSHLKVAR